ncbi:MAG: hypothetical protein ACREOZ_01350 [Gloeomargaritales cyanobacterium]
MSYDCEATTTAIAAQTSIDRSTENDEDENDSSRKRSRVNFTGVGKIVQMMKICNTTATPTDDAKSKLICDSAANISVIGKNWQIVQRSLRSIDIVGFAED